MSATDAPAAVPGPAPEAPARRKAYRPPAVRSEPVGRPPDLFAGSGQGRDPTDGEGQP